MKEVIGEIASNAKGGTQLETIGFKRKYSLEMKE